MTAVAATLDMTKNWYMGCGGQCEGTEAEKEADRKAIKVMLKGDDYMLEQIIEYLEFNGPEYLVKEIYAKKDNNKNFC